MDMSAVDIARIPYNADVLAYVQKWRSAGGHTALVTASHQALAEKIAAHHGIFDEVYGSSGSNNLKGASKAVFLEERFGKQGFDYMGDARADIPVWEKATKAITVNIPRSLRTRVEALGHETEHVGSKPRCVKPYLRALRPHQWLKNLLVFAPILLAQQLSWDTAWWSLIAFVSFSLIASSVYVVNDLLDLEADRAHPRKRDRPFASGSLPISHGTWLVPILVVIGFLIASLLGLKFILVMLSYYAATIIYSLYLKRHFVIDICTLAGLYTMRIIAGGIAAEITLSIWLLTFSVFLFFALAAVKRQAELVDGAASGKVSAHGRGYHVDDLPLIANMATSSGYVSVLVMALYLNSPAVQELYTSPSVLWGICPVLFYWISRMVMVTHRGDMHDDPIVFAVKDHISLLCMLIMFSLAVGGALL